MAFSNEVLREAWQKAGGQCECTRRTHRHFYIPCGRSLNWEKRDNVTSGGWQARYINAFAGDTPANCEILCMECHEALP
jgi:hypothetical protein